MDLQCLVQNRIYGSVGKDDTGDFFENDMKMAGVKPFYHAGNQ